MNVFIDTNVLLDLYHLSGPDLDELRKVIKLAEIKKLNVLLPAQVEDEFWRNRERVISEALDLFDKTKASATLPNLIRSNPKSSELRQAVERVNDLVKELRKVADLEIADHKLKADDVIDSLFKQCPPLAVDANIIDRAKARKELGNPPGKANSLGDAVNWEWLLESTPKGESLVIISSDGDFESELLKGRPKEFLAREWTRAMKGDLELFKGLPDFLKKYFPDIKLSDEIDKSIAIENLENSLSFMATHNAIASLQKYDDFKEADLLRIIDAYSSNQQIRWILGDGDVRSFADKVVALLKTEMLKEAAKPLLKMLEQLETQETDEDENM
jgi:predicted nucleic acid-binding protein